MRRFTVLVLAMLLAAGVSGTFPATTAAIPPPTEELVMLRANSWQWVAFTNPVESVTIDDPSRYTVTFHDDATITVGADCNQALGSYQGEGGSLQIVMGPMTAAACPPGSRGEQLVRLLGSAALYFFQDGHLFIDLFADGGTLEFAPVPLLAADDGNGDPHVPEQVAETLGNLTYPGVIGTGPVTLTNGMASYTEPDSAATPYVRLLARAVPTGDLDGDGALDAVAVLEDNASGTGRFLFLAPVRDVLGTPEVAPALMVADRSQIVSLQIAGGEVALEMITGGPGDAACCPGQRVRVTYVLQEGALSEQSRQDLGRVTLADLEGSQWRLVEVGGEAPPIPPGVEVTLNVTPGRINGSGGCNAYTASISPAGEAAQGITIGPIAATRKLCSEPIARLEQAVFARLEGSAAWGFDGGDLALSYSLPDQEPGYLRFESVPAEVVEAATPIAG